MRSRLSPYSTRNNVYVSNAPLGILNPMPRETVYNTWDAKVGSLIDHPDLGIGLITAHRVYPGSEGYPSRRTFTILWDLELGAIECESSILDEARVVVEGGVHFPS